MKLKFSQARIFFSFLVLFRRHVGLCAGSLSCSVVLRVLSIFAIILLRKWELVACFHFIVFCFRVAFCVLCLFIRLPWVALWSMIVAFPSHTCTH